MSTSFIEVKNLEKVYAAKASFLNRKPERVIAVDNVSFSIKRGEEFSVLLVNRGAEKAQLASRCFACMRLRLARLPIKTKTFTNYQKKDMRRLRPKLQFVFQDPFSSLNPRLRIGEALAEPLLDHGLATKATVREKVLSVMELCGLPHYHIDKFPHEFSGGQRQRIGIARAVIMDPEFIVADEPVSALDVSIQAQIINLFQELQEKKNMAYLFISHDLSVVEHLCTRIGVLYLGTMMELGSRDQLYQNPLHPYTRALLAAVPVPILSEDGSMCTKRRCA